MSFRYRFFAYFIVMIIVMWYGNKNKLLNIIVSVLFSVLTLMYLFFNYFGRLSVLAVDSVILFVIFSVPAIFDFIKIPWQNYLLLFAGFLYLDSVGSYYVSILFGHVFTFASFLIALCAVFKISVGKLRGNIFNVWIIFITMVLEYVILHFVIRSFRRVGYEVFNNPIFKLIFWGASTFLFVSVNLAIIYFIKLILKKYFYEINKMGYYYPVIENSFIFISAIIMVLIMMFNYLYTKLVGYDENIYIFLELFCIFIFFIQFFYLNLIFKLTYLKDIVNYREQQNKNLALYSSGLERNLDNIKNIKHDIKNIFITMGQFVEQSDNQEMKDFYKQKIFPFASDEIKKNDLYAKLSHLSNEELKAFLYYKISQGLERNIDIRLDIKVLNNLLIPMDIIDLIRILGILLDNAIEACENIEDSFISITIAQNNLGCSYSIENSILNVNKIVPGFSTKGKDRGRGLIIIQDILEHYDFVTFSSLINEKSLSQKLNIFFE